MNRVSQILGAAAVIAIAIVFVVQFRPASTAQFAGAAPTCAIEVSGHCISSTEFWASYRLIAPRGADPARLRAMGLRRLTAEGLLERWLLNEDAKRLGITVSEDDLTEELVSGRFRVSVPADKARNLAYALQLHEDGIRFMPVKNRQTKKFDRKTYEREVRLMSNMSPTDFREYQKKELLAARMRDLVRSRVQVGENEAFEQFSREKSTATIDYVRLDRGWYADVAIDASKKAVDAWAASNKEEIERVWGSRKDQYLPECRLTRHVLAKVDRDAPDPEAAKAAAKKKIEAALARIEKGDDFAEVARAMSDDTSATRGGDLGCVAKGRMVKPFEDAVFSLEAGKVSGVVESEFGYHLVKVERIAKDADAEALGREQIARELYVGREADRMAAEGAKQILAAVRGGKPLAEAVKAHVAEVAKASGAGKKGDKKAEKKAEAKDGKEGTEKEEGAKTDAKKADEPITAETHPGRPEVMTSMPFNASGDPIQDVRPGIDVAKMAFDLEKPGDVPNDVVPLETGYAVIQLKEKAPASKEQWDKDREFYMSAMRAARQDDALVGYLRQLRSKLATEVKYSQSLVTEPKDDKGEGDGPPPVDLGDE